jgi:hypothetical protein
MRSVKYKSELITSLILIFILGLFLKPSKLLMPMSSEVMLALFLVVAFLLFAAVFWKEGSGDERENLHKLNAGRISYLVGAAVLVVAIISQSMMHDVDPWLVYTLISMVLAKIGSRVYSQIMN